MTKVDCEDCYEKFNTKKLYITHVKSKSCTKEKSRKATKIRPLGEPSQVEAKKARLEVQGSSRISDPLSLGSSASVAEAGGQFASPARLEELQGQIKNLSEEQKKALQEQITRKQKQVLQAIPYNQLSAKQKEILKKLSSSGGRTVSTPTRIVPGVTVVTPPPPAPQYTNMSHTPGPPSTKFITLKAGQVNSPKPPPPPALGMKKSNIQIVRRTTKFPGLDVVNISETSIFSDESIAAEFQPIDPGKEDSDDSVDFSEAAPKIGCVTFKSFAKTMINIPNVLKKPDRPETPTNKPQATVKENCPKCKKIFSKNSMEAHMDAKHKVDCPKCEKRFFTEELDSHIIKDHEKPKEECSICQEVVYSRVLAQHTDTLHKVKCKMCHDKFLGSDLNEHIRNVHETEVCTDCSARFCTTEDLNSHLNSKHLVELCDECEKRFRTVTELDIHIEKDHPKEYCDEEGCESWFKTTELLAVHKDKKHPNPNKFVTFGGGMFMMMMVPDENKDNEDLSEEYSDESTEDDENNVICKELVLDIIQNLNDERNQEHHIEGKNEESSEICKLLMEDLFDELDLFKSATTKDDLITIGEDISRGELDAELTEGVWS